MRKYYLYLLYLIGALWLILAYVYLSNNLEANTGSNSDIVHGKINSADESSQSFPRVLPPRILEKNSEPYRASQLKVENIVVSVVNLPYREEKWIETASSLAESKLLESMEIQRSFAVVGKNVNLIDLYESKKLSKAAYRSMIYPRRVYGEYMTPGGLGCLLSHVNLWKECAERNKTMIIFEDDIILGKNFESDFKQCLAELPSDFGLFYFADMVGFKLTGKKAHEFSTHLHKLSGLYWGTYAYMISPAAAAVLLNDIFPITFQVDSHIQAACQENDVDVYRSKKNLVLTDNSGTRKSDVQIRIQDGNSRKILIPEHFHVLKVARNVKMNRLTERLKQKDPTIEEKLIVWDRITLQRYGIKYSNATIGDPLYSLKMRYLDLAVLFNEGGFVVRPEFKSGFKLLRIVQARQGFISYEYDINDEIVFPFMGAKKEHPSVYQIMISLDNLIKSRTISPNATAANEQFMKSLQSICSTQPEKDKLLLFPADILTQNTLK